MNNIAQDIALTIRDQIGIRTLASLGAHDLRIQHSDRERGGLHFTARILPFLKDGTRGIRARNMFVDVILNGHDLYDVQVSYLKGYTVVDHFRAGDVYAPELGSLLLALDYDGDMVLNPRLA